MSLTALRLAADPGVGSTRDQVIDELGTPRSQLAVGSDELLTFPRGTVSLVDGVVTKTNLLSIEEWARREHLRVSDIRAKAEAKAKERERVAEMKAEDNEALNGLTATAEWADATGAERVAMIDRFSRLHPYAEIGAVRPAAELRRDRETTEKAKLSELETRVAAAESRAGDAESRAATAESNAAAASADAATARRAADDAARNATYYNNGGVLAYGYVGGRPYYDYNYSRRGTVVVGAGGTVIPGGRGPVTVIRSAPTPTVTTRTVTVTQSPPGQAPIRTTTVQTQTQRPANTPVNPRNGR